MTSTHTSIQDLNEALGEAGCYQEFWGWQLAEGFIFGALDILSQSKYDIYEPLLWPVYTPLGKQLDNIQPEAYDNPEFIKWVVDNGTDFIAHFTTTEE